MEKYPAAVSVVYADAIRHEHDNAPIVSKSFFMFFFVFWGYENREQRLSLTNCPISYVHFREKKKEIVNNFYYLSCSFFLQIKRSRNEVAGTQKTRRDAKTRSIFKCFSQSHRDTEFFFKNFAVLREKDEQVAGKRIFAKGRSRPCVNGGFYQTIAQSALR